MISTRINKKQGSSIRPQPGKTWCWSIFGSFCLIIGVTIMTLNTIHWLNHSQLKCHKQSLSLHIATEGNCSIENQTAAGCKTLQVEAWRRRNYALLVCSCGGISQNTMTVIHLKHFLSHSFKSQFIHLPFTEPLCA